MPFLSYWSSQLTREKNTTFPSPICSCVFIHGVTIAPSLCGVFALYFLCYAYSLCLLFSIFLQPDLDLSVDSLTDAIDDLLSRISSIVDVNNDPSVKIEPFAEGANVNAAELQKKKKDTEAGGEGSGMCCVALFHVGCSVCVLFSLRLCMHLLHPIDQSHVLCSPIILHTIYPLCLPSLFLLT